MSIINDKYVLTASAVILVIAVISLTGIVPDPSPNAEITGIASDVRTTANGNTFVLTDSHGSETKCFYTEEVRAGNVYTVSGRYSDDGTILFVSRMGRG